MPWGALVGGMFSGLLGGMLGFAAADKQTAHEQQVHDENLQFQREQYEYVKQQNDLTRFREDTAVQRRVADLKAAGLSPVLAAGSAASSEQASPTVAPQRGVTNHMRKLQAVEMFLNIARQSADISRTNAETERIKELTANDVQQRDINYKDYLLRQRGVVVDEQRLAYVSQELGIREAQLRHDAIRIAQDEKRINNDMARIFNDTERLTIEKNSFKLQKLMHEVQRRHISEQTVSERLRQMGIRVDTEAKIQEYQSLVYDFTLMSNLGLPTRQHLPTYQHMNWNRGASSMSAYDKSVRDVMERVRSTNAYGDFLRGMYD